MRIPLPLCSRMMLPCSKNMDDCFKSEKEVKINLNPEISITTFARDNSLIAYVITQTLTREDLFDLFFSWQKVTFASKFDLEWIKSRWITKQQKTKLNRQEKTYTARIAITSHLHKLLFHVRIFGVSRIISQKLSNLNHSKIKIKKVAY